MFTIIQFPIYFYLFRRQNSVFRRFLDFKFHLMRLHLWPFSWIFCSGLVLFLRMRKVRSERASSEMWKVTNLSSSNVQTIWTICMSMQYSVDGLSRCLFIILSSWYLDDSIFTRIYYIFQFPYLLVGCDVLPLMGAHQKMVASTITSNEAQWILSSFHLLFFLFIFLGWRAHSFLRVQKMQQQTAVFLTALCEFCGNDILVHVVGLYWGLGFACLL